MGSEQSTQIVEPRITEIANFDFRDKPRRRKRRLREHYECRNRFESPRSSNGSWRNKESTKIYRWQRTKITSWLEEGRAWVVNCMILLLTKCDLNSCFEMTYWINIYLDNTSIKYSYPAQNVHMFLCKVYTDFLRMNCLL